MSTFRSESLISISIVSSTTGYTQTLAKLVCRRAFESIRADPHQPMHASLGLQPAIGVRAGDQQRCRLDAGLLALAGFLQLHLVAVLLGPPHIHPQQHLGPILGFGAARPGVQFHVTIVGVGLTGQQAFDFPPLRLLGQSTQTGGRFGRHRRIAIGLGKFDQFQRVGNVGFQFPHRLHLRGE